MTRVRITEDEAYPVYGWRDLKGVSNPDVLDIADVPPEMLEDWERVLAEYERIQEEMEGFLTEARKRRYEAES